MPETPLFDPRNHRLCETRYFEDFQVGERFVLPSRTMTDALFAAFQLASGDNHPVHYDVEYCRARGMPTMLAHGFQVLAQTCGGAGLFAHYVEDSLKGFIEQSSRFLDKVFVGDTLYAALEVAELVPNRSTGVLTLRSTVHNQHGTLVMDGLQKYLILKRDRSTSGNALGIRERGGRNGPKRSGALEADGEPVAGPDPACTPTRS